MPLRPHIALSVSVASAAACGGATSAAPDAGAVGPDGTVRHTVDEVGGVSVRDVVLLGPDALLVRFDEPVAPADLPDATAFALSAAVGYRDPGDPSYGLGYATTLYYDALYAACYVGATQGYGADCYALERLLVTDARPIPASPDGVLLTLSAPMPDEFTRAYCAGRWSQETCWWFGSETRECTAGLFLHIAVEAGHGNAEGGHRVQALAPHWSLSRDLLEPTGAGAAMGAVRLGVETTYDRRPGYFADLHPERPILCAPELARAYDGE